MPSHRKSMKYKFRRVISVMCYLCLISACVAEPTPHETIPIPTMTSKPDPTPTLGVGSTWQRPIDDMTMVYVPEGPFLMGTDSGGWSSASYESPQHEVFVDSFWIDRTEVTNAQFRLCVEAGACEPPHDDSSYSRSTYFDNRIFDDYPVIHINWFQALAYCTWAGFRLPTEAEWEYVARGSEGWLYPWGDEFEGTRLNYCDAYCNLSKADKSFSDGYLDTAPVGSYHTGASWCGALDMTGNVWEWVMDWMTFYPDHPYRDRPSSIPAETYRVIRGGSWDTTSDHARTAFRNWLSPFQTYDSVGFRCASTTISSESAELPGSRLPLSSRSK